MVSGNKIFGENFLGFTGKLRRPVVFIPFIFLFIAGTGILFILSVYLGSFGRLQTRDELLGLKNATASLVYSEEGMIIGRFFSENRTNVAFGQIPPHLIDALIATEDIRFYRHNGIDYRSLMRVMVKSVILNNNGAGGGSTISQQLVKNLLGRGDYGLLTLPVNKTREIILAYRIENALTKEEILTLYLNTVSFGENVYGIGTASLRYFNKKVEYLTLDESAVLIGMLKANTLYNPRIHPENATFRRNVVLRQMEKYSLLEPYEADSLCGLSLGLNYLNLEAQNPAGYFLVRVKREALEILHNIYSLTGHKWNLEEDGLIINTSMSFDLQYSALKAFRNHLPHMQKRLSDHYAGVTGKRLLEVIARREMDRMDLNERANDTIFQRTFNWEGSYNELLTVADSVKYALTLLHGGLLALNPKTGAVKSYIGGIDFQTQPFDQILARRQLASAFKPVLYAAALEKGIEPCQYYDNDSIVFVNYDDWTPVNYDRTYGGRYSLSEALARSLNVPTVNLFLDTGFGKTDSLWKDMGFSFPLSFHPAIALGTAEASVLETAIAYSAFANGGYKVTPYSIESIITEDGKIIYEKPLKRDRTRIMSERTSMLMNAMLQKAINEGTGISVRQIYGIDMPLAGKTGTSQNYGDAWFVAYNPGMVMVSRAGASTPSIHFSGSSGSGSALALPLVALTLQDVQHNRNLAGRLVSPFPALPAELRNAMDCHELEEKSIFELIIDIFKRDERTTDIEIKKPQPKTREEKERPPFLKRLFRRRK